MAGPMDEDALELARLSFVLPAVLVVPVEPDLEGLSGLLVVRSAAIRSYDAARRRELRLVSRAPVPLDGAPTSEFAVFRGGEGMRDQVAVIVGRPDLSEPVAVRIHSACLTGDLFGSLKCDCGPQLDAALARMAEEADNGGYGVLLYMRQEGRGIGLVNKMRAYRLQDQGFDTIEANERLGLPDEARDFTTAARMLRLLGIGEIGLLTNNTRKVSALAAQGISIACRVEHALPSNPHNRRYLDTKRDRAGHLLP